jgi:hypothetical protein
MRVRSSAAVSCSTQNVIPMAELAHASSKPPASWDVCGKDHADLRSVVLLGETIAHLFRPRSIADTRTTMIFC